MARPGSATRVAIKRPAWLDPSYTRFVRLMKVVLPAAALGLVVTLVMWPDEDSSGALPLAFSRIEADGDGLRMVSPHYIGNDEEGRPFSIRAAWAIQDSFDPTRVDMNAPDFEMTNKDGTWFNLTAAQGVYLPKADTMHLSGGVHLFTDRGYEAQTDEIAIDLEAGTAVGPTPVQAQGPAGEIAAKRFEVLDQGNRLRFEGGVTLVLRPAAQDAPT